MVKTTSRGPARGPWVVAKAWFLCLHKLKEPSRAFPRAVLKTTGREVSREDAQSVKYMFDKDFKHDASKLMFARKDPPWVTRDRGKVNNSHRRGRSSPGSSVSGSSYGSSSSYSPIIQRGGMSLVKLKTSKKKTSSLLSIHLEYIPEDNPLSVELRAYLSQKEKGDTFASIAKDDIDDIKSYEKPAVVSTRMDPPWVTRRRGKGNNSHERGTSSPGSSVSGSSYRSSSSYSPIIQRGGMSLVKLKTSQKEASSSSSIHLEDIAEDNPLYAELRAYSS
ncbi:hypothetical protein H5410_015731 [Solanum commersonii]|uniref:Uncharacterized protein n=1 Tax=Solanum commersonii TaxID=4109 RepID=A0A9J5ZUY5_SOLCO|nr:hypothetical protein H5410_015731 [Solanum commersonii]